MQISLNLATRRYYDRRRCKQLLALLLGGLLVLSGIGANRLANYRAKHDRLSAEISILDKRLSGHPSGVDEQEFARHSRQLAAINTLLSQRQHSWLALLDTLEDTLPVGGTYTHIVPDQKTKQVKLEGRVRSMGALSHLLERLGAANGFRTPTLLSTTTKQQDQPGEAEGIAFVITVGWDGP